MLKKNLMLLAKRNPNLAYRIGIAPITGRYKVLKSQRSDQMFNIIDLKTNLYHYNQYDPYIGVKMDIEKMGILLPNLAVFFGFGLGYHVNEYMNKYPFATVLVIEEDLEILKTVFSITNLSKLLTYPHFYIVSGLTPVQMYPELFNFFNQAHLLQFLSAINMIQNSISVSGSKEFYVNMLRILKEAVTNVLGLYGNDPHDSLIGIQMTLRNLGTIVDNPGIEELKDKFKGKPGIVVSTGPSLNKNVEFLKGLDNKAVIVAADATVKVLLKRGIKAAHMVTSLERVIETAGLFEGLTEEDVKDSYLSACPVVVPETYANYPGEKIIVYRNFATFKWIDIPKGILDIGPSAGNMAFKVLEWLGCDPIILIGQDLAFSDDGITHAEGTHYGEKAESYLAEGTVFVPGNYQEKVKTSPTFSQFLRHYERDVSAYKGEVINATEGGAKIEGAQLMTFQEAIDKYVKDDIDTLDIIKKNLKTPTIKVKKREVKELLKKLHDAIKFSDNLVEKLNIGVEHCLAFEEIVKVDPELEDADNLEKCSELIRKIEKAQESFNSKEFYLIFMHYVQSYYIKASMDINHYKYKIKPSTDLNKILVVKFKEFYSVIAALINKLNIEFKEALVNMEKHLSEMK